MISASMQISKAMKKLCDDDSAAPHAKKK